MSRQNEKQITMGIVLNSISNHSVLNFTCKTKPNTFSSSNLSHLATDVWRMIDDVNEGF